MCLELTGNKDWHRSMAWEEKVGADDRNIHTHIARGWEPVRVGKIKGYIPEEIILRSKAFDQFVYLVPGVIHHDGNKTYIQYAKLFSTVVKLS